MVTRILVNRNFSEIGAQPLGSPGFKVLLRINPVLSDVYAFMLFCVLLHSVKIHFMISVARIVSITIWYRAMDACMDCRKSHLLSPVRS